VSSETKTARSKTVPHPVPVQHGEGQESVWDYPRPPRVESTSAMIEITLGGVVVAQTKRSFRVLETSHPPTFYLPVEAFRPGSLSRTSGQSLCEWKGVAGYFDVAAGSVVARRAAWGYPNPTSPYRQLREHVAVYPSAMDACTVDGEVVAAQPGDFYGGWITTGVVGPFKGDVGSRFW
jgi:uncharacterized protein (DUF427 family)